MTERKLIDRRVRSASRPCEGILRMRLALLLLLVPATAFAEADPEAVTPVLRTTEMCIDQEIADRLAIKRKRRGAVDRLFVKQGRHELTGGGGYYASDLLSGTYRRVARGSRARRRPHRASQDRHLTPMDPRAGDEARRGRMFASR